MLRRPGISKHLADDQCWAIVCADPSVISPWFDEAIDAHAGTLIHAVQWR